MCLVVFAAMVLGSGSTSSKDAKKVVTDQATEKVDAVAEGSTEKEAAEPSSKVTTTIDEQVLIDQAGIVVTATEYVTDKIWGDGVKLLLENSTDKDVTVGCDALIVNDYMISDLFVSDIAAGKKANETLYISSQQLNAAGIEFSDIDSFTKSNGEAISEGKLVYLAGKYSSSVGPAFALVMNAVNGNVIRDAEGNAVSISQNYQVATDEATFDEFFKTDNGDNPIYNKETLDTIIGDSVTCDDITKLVESK